MPQRWNTARPWWRTRDLINRRSRSWRADFWSSPSLWSRAYPGRFSSTLTMQTVHLSSKGASKYATYLSEDSPLVWNSYLSVKVRYVCKHRMLAVMYAHSFPFALKPILSAECDVHARKMFSIMPELGRPKAGETNILPFHEAPVHPICFKYW